VARILSSRAVAPPFRLPFSVPSVLSVSSVVEDVLRQATRNSGEPQEPALRDFAGVPAYSSSPLSGVETR